MLLSRTAKTHAVFALPLLAAALVLSGCSAAPDEPDEDTAANDRAAAKFVACLIDQGQTAKIIEGGMVGMLLPEGEDGGPGLNSSAGGDAPTSMSMMFQDDEGSWMASDAAGGYPEDGGMREAWTACAEEVPDFEQPAPDMSGGDGESHIVTREDAIEAGLAFAACARENGYADFEDPDAEGQIAISSDFTEDTFRSLLEACSDVLGGMGIPISQETAEALDFDWMSVMSEFIEGPTGGVGGPQVRTEGK
jgi:hypothetical protein